MVEVFKTNVGSKKESIELIRQLLLHFPDSKINFDLDDRDKILRIEGSTICLQTISKILAARNYTCNILV